MNQKKNFYHLNGKRREKSIKKNNSKKISRFSLKYLFILLMVFHEENSMKVFGWKLIIYRKL
jgi:hypothetical protein